MKTINEIRNIEAKIMLMDPILPMETHHHGHNMAAVIDQHDSGQHAGHMQLNHQPMDIEQEREVLFFFRTLSTYASLLSRRLKYIIWLPDVASKVNKI